MAVAGVYFAANGSTITSPVTTSPYTTTWTPSAGTYNIQAIAYDAAKNYATSTSITLTVNAPTVTGGGGSTSSGGGGGGSSSGSYSGTGSFTPTVPQRPVLNTPIPGNCPRGYVCTLKPVTGTASTASATSRILKTFRFTTTLRTYSTSPNVKNLQIFLNDRGYTVSKSGLGSKGFESTYFGPATVKALAAFQRANNITPALGNFGPITQARVNVMLSSDH